MPACAARGIASGRGGASGWAHLDVDREDLVDLALASDLHKLALAESSCGKCKCQFNVFVAWCDASVEPRASLPASDGTVALYLKLIMNAAKTFVNQGQHLPIL